MNKVCFDGLLEPIELRYKKNNYCSGVLIIEENDDEIDKYSIELDPSLSNSQGLDSVLLHEMVHYWCVVNENERRHNKKFLEKLKEVETNWATHLISAL